MAFESIQLIRDTIAECNRLSRLAAHVEVAGSREGYHLASRYVSTQPRDDLYQAARAVHELTQQLIEGSAQFRGDDAEWSKAIDCNTP